MHVWNEIILVGWIFLKNVLYVERHSKKILPFSDLLAVISDALHERFVPGVGVFDQLNRP